MTHFTTQIKSFERESRLAILLASVNFDLNEEVPLMKVYLAFLVYFSLTTYLWSFVGLALSQTVNI